MVTLFPDTNVFLHYPPLAHVDGSALAGDAEVRLVVCLQVIDELDRKKSDPMFADRAQQAIKEIQKARATETALRPGVTLSVFAASVRREDFGALKDPDQGDDRIVRQVLRYQEQHTGERVAVVTEDYGMELRGHSQGIAHIVPDRSTRKPTPADENLRKLRKAEAELVALKASYPELRILLCAPGAEPGPEASLTLAPDGVPVHDVAAELEAEMRKHPRRDGWRPLDAAPGHYEKVGFSRDERIDPDEVARYTKEREAYRTAYAAHLQTLNDHRDWVGRIFELEVWLENTGGAPAEVVEARLILPHGFVQLGLAEEDRLPRPMITSGPPSPRIEAPRPPPPPRPPIPPRTFAERYREDNRDSIIRSLMRPPGPRPVRAHVTQAEDGAFVLGVDVDDLRHLTKVHMCTVVGVFATWEDAHPFKAAFTATAANYPKPMTGDVLVTVTVTGDAQPT